MVITWVKQRKHGNMKEKKEALSCLSPSNGTHYTHKSQTVLEGYGMYKRFSLREMFVGGEIEKGMKR